MNDMNGDYLWDRTGEPDPEVQQLEEVLGTLRYQPLPLEIPAGVGPRRQRFNFSGFGSSFASRLAIAAAIAVIVLGLGLWVGLQKRSSPESVKVERAHGTSPGTTQPIAPVAVAPNKAGEKAVTVAIDGGDKPRLHKVGPGLVSRGVVAANTNRNRHAAMKNSELAASELKEAEAAKQQLMLALRVASAKLNFAQRKTQGTNPENQIHNQHKIG
ncbi:MAG: hypothetical protein M3R69_14460 [Acidobacteriota bacterium]|nr:hypothetical protein [Acidobacteriota bacterium]